MPSASPTRWRAATATASRRCPTACSSTRRGCDGRPNGGEGPPEGSPSLLAPRTARPCAVTLLESWSVVVRLVALLVPLAVVVVALVVHRVDVVLLAGPARHALAKRVAVVAVRAVEVTERLAVVRGREGRIGALGLALLGRVLELGDVVGVGLVLLGLQRARLGGHALAERVAAVLALAVELLEGLAVVRSREVGVAALGLALLGGVLQRGLLLGVLLG